MGWQARRLWHLAGVSGLVFAVSAVFTPATAVCFSWRPRSGTEYLLLQALSNPFALLELFSFGLCVGFGTAGIVCFVIARAFGARAAPGKQESNERKTQQR